MVAFPRFATAATVFLAAGCCSVGQSTAAATIPLPLPHLFMDPGDVATTRGLVGVEAGVLAYDHELSQPPLSALSPPTAWCSHPYRVAPTGHLCATVIGALPSLNRPAEAGAEYEVYVARSPDPLTVLGCKSDRPRPGRGLAA